MPSHESTQQMIRCPECRTVIPLSEALTVSIREQFAEQQQLEYQQRLRQQKDEFELRLAKERDEARAETLAEEALERQARTEEMLAKDGELKRLRENELDLRRRQHELERDKATVELTVERRLAAAKNEVESVLRAEIAEQHRLRDLEKDHQVTVLREQVEAMSRRLRQGSQQLQGEVLELDVAAQLQAAFPQDRFEAIARGTKGGDILQTVVDPRGQSLGSILWECKNTKAFQDAWVQKLRRDQRATKADLAVLLTVVLPKGISHFADRGGVWVTGHHAAVPLATALRSGIAQAGRARAMSDGQGEKQMALYAYVGGKHFRQRIEAIVESALALLNDEQRERAAFERHCAARVKHVESMLRATAGLYGDVDGLVGGSLPRVARLESGPSIAA
jgi:hypothetical protein